jgi:enediyne biosynthesis protein E4
VRGPAVASISLALAACGPSAPAPLAPPESPAETAGALFEDVTSAAGIDFVHALADGRMDNLIEAVGAGATWFDADGDGRLDLFLAQQPWLEGVSSGKRPEKTPTSRLFRNLGAGRFEDATARAGLGTSDFCFGALAADVDADGAIDLYLLCDGPNRLFRNRGDGTFADVTEKAGVGCPSCSVAGAVLDANGDGLLDLYVGNYVAFDPKYRLHYAPDAFPGPLAFEAQPDVLYVNRGDGTFRDATAESGLGAVTPARAMGATAWDCDLDGRTDLFVANDGSAAFLFHNEGGGRFTETAVRAGVAYGFHGEAAAAMAGAVGDVDGDGRPDLHVTNAAYGSLFHNEGGGLFRDRAVASGLAGACGQYVAWGGGFADFDDDGAADLFVANGDLHRATGRPDLFLRGSGDGRFEDAGALGGPYFRRELPSRAAAIADFDDDGRLDVVVTTIGGPAVVLRNRGVAGNHWTTLALHGPRGNWAALGAVATVEAGGRRQVQVANGQTGYLTQGDPRLHFGLGAADRIERITVRWPDGTQSELRSQPADRVVRISWGEAPR